MGHTPLTMIEGTIEDPVYLIPYWRLPGQFYRIAASCIDGMERLEDGCVALKLDGKLPVNTGAIAEQIAQICPWLAPGGTP